MPYAEKFQLHIFAALAKQERDFISARTKAALPAAKARGVKLGGIGGSTVKRNAAARAKADRDAATVAPIIKAMRDDNEALQSIANALNTSGIPTPRGGQWTATSVKRVIDRTQPPSAAYPADAPRPHPFAGEELPSGAARKF